MPYSALVGFPKHLFGYYLNEDADSILCGGLDSILCGGTHLPGGQTGFKLGQCNLIYLQLWGHIFTLQIHIQLIHFFWASV